MITALTTELLIPFASYVETSESAQAGVGPSIVLARARGDTEC